MDPNMNQNPTTNPSAGTAPGVTPVSGAAAPAPAAPGAPATGATPGAAAPAPAAPGMAAPAPAPAAPAPVASDPMTAAPTVPTPENPVVNPIGNEMAGGSAINPIYQPTGGGMSPTAPLTQPEPAKGPDPVEEELKAPMKAAAPAPGSIGSAISGPEGAATETTGENVFAATGQGTPSVAFNDPATQPDAVTGDPAKAAKPAKKKTSKTTWALLAVVGVMIIIALVVVLLMQTGVLAM